MALSKTKGKPADIDGHVGKMLRLRRQTLGVAQQALANQLNISFQQLQKYEKGQNRISAGVLYRLSKMLDVSLDYFFQDFDGRGIDPNEASKILPDSSSISEETLLSKETTQLIFAYYKIQSADSRKNLMSLMHAFESN